MLDEYKTIANEIIGEGFYSEKRSKFLAFAHHIESVDEAKKIVDGYRKKYYDARHVCYAYMLGAERLEFRANDDGEPSATAGKPILGQINSNELTDILIVVIRYYGELDAKRRAWRQKESLARRPRRASASDLRMESVMEQVLSKVWEMMRGCISFTTFITSFIMG